MSQSALQLYQSVVLEHNRSPRGYGDVPGATAFAEGFNPICGDRVKVQLMTGDGKLTKVGFTAQCCALCQASASVMVEVVSNQSVSDALAAAKSFEPFIQNPSDQSSILSKSPAQAFQAIREFPARAKCVLLPWRTLLSALSDQHPVSTEPKE